ncbi:MAG: hypothetical protein ABIT83_26060 [Massilia sp.]
MVKLGESGSTLKKRLAPKVKLEAHPAGIDFLTLDWSIKNPQTVTFEHGKSSLRIDKFLSVLATQDHDFAIEGIFEINVSCTLSATDFLEHEQARLLLTNPLKNALRHGSRAVIPRHLPRIHARDLYQYQFSTHSYVPQDANYVPTAEEWLQLPGNTTWELYADRVFLSINIDRHQSKADKSTPDVYLISYNFQSENNYYRGNVADEFRTKWLSKLASSLVTVAEQRAKREAEVRALGIPVDEEYVDPTLPTTVSR